MYDWFPGFPGGGIGNEFFQITPCPEGDRKGDCPPPILGALLVSLEVFKDHANPLQETFSGGGTFGCGGWTFGCGG